MATTAIELHQLSRTFMVRTAPSSFRGSLRQLLRAPRHEVAALRDLTFSVDPGERVAFVGPNGAGKSTAIKILTGILRPTSGTARVSGRIPWEDRTELGFEIAAVFGQRSRLWSQLPARDTFDLLARVYNLDHRTYRRRLLDLVDALEIGSFIDRPVRLLSLGERMRCELAASLLHAPLILFLDEPTIGLDVVARARLREIVRERSERDGCTVVLTSHDTGDMETVCDRVIVLHNGSLLLDQPVSTLRRQYVRRKVVTLVTEESEVHFDAIGAAVVASEPHRLVLRVDTDRTDVDELIRAVTDRCRLLDLTVEDPPLDEVIQKIYATGQRPQGILQ